MTGDGSFFPDQPSINLRNTKSVLNYHPVLEFNGNKNDFWLLFDDSDILEKHQSRPLRKPQKPFDAQESSLKRAPQTGEASKPGFSNTFTEASSKSGGFLQPKDDDDDNDDSVPQTSDKRLSSDRSAGSPGGKQSRLDRSIRAVYNQGKRTKESFRDRRRSRSPERHRSRSRERHRSRSLERRRVRSPDRRRSPDRDRGYGDRRGLHSDRRRSWSREKRGGDRTRSRDRKDRERRRLSPSTSRKDGHSKRSASASSNSSDGGSRGRDRKAVNSELLKKFAEKLQEKANKPPYKSLSSVRLNSRLEDTRHRRAEAVTPIVFSLKKAAVKSFPATTSSQMTEAQNISNIELPKENVSDPSKLVSSTDTNIPLPTDNQYTAPPPLIPLPQHVSQAPPPLIPPSVSHQAQPLRVTDGVTLACAPTLYRDGKKAPVSTAVLALPPPSQPPPAVVSQPLPVVTQPPPLFSQPPPVVSLPPEVSQPMEVPVITEMHQSLAAQALEYATMVQVQDSMPPGQMVPITLAQQNMGIPPPGFGPMMRMPPGPPPGLPRPGQGIRPGMMGSMHFGHPGLFMGPPPCGPEGPFMCPPPHGSEGPFMGPPPHGSEGPFMGPPPHGSEGPFMGPPPHGPEGPFMVPPPQGPEGRFMGPPPLSTGGQFVGPPGPEARPLFGVQGGSPQAPRSNNIVVSMSSSPIISTRTASQQRATRVTATCKAEVASRKRTSSTVEKGKPASSAADKMKPRQTAENTKTTSSPPVLAKATFSPAEKDKSPSSVSDKKKSPSKPVISSLNIRSFEKVKFMTNLIKFIQNKSDLKKQIAALEKSPSDEYCIKNGLLCTIKKESEEQVLVIVVPEDGHARRTIVTAFVLKYPDMDVDALIELFEQAFSSMPMEDIEDVFEDEATRSSTLLKSADSDFSKIESISSCGAVVLQGASFKSSDEALKLEKSKSASSSENVLKKEKTKPHSKTKLEEKAVDSLKDIGSTSPTTKHDSETSSMSGKGSVAFTAEINTASEISQAPEESRNAKSLVLSELKSTSIGDLAVPFTEMENTTEKFRAPTQSETAESSGPVPSEELKSSSGKTDSHSLPTAEIEKTPDTSLPPEQSEVTKSSVPLCSEESKSGDDSPVLSASEIKETSGKPLTVEESKTAESAALPKKLIDSSNKIYSYSISTSSDLKPDSTAKEKTGACKEKTEADSALGSNAVKRKPMVEESEQAVEGKIATSPAADDELKKSSDKSKEKDTILVKDERKSAPPRSATAESKDKGPSEDLKKSSGKTDSPELAIEIQTTPEISLPPEQDETAKSPVPVSSNELKSSSAGKVDSPVVSTSEITETAEKSVTLNESKTSESAASPEKSVDSSSKIDSFSLSTSSNLKPDSTPKEETSASTQNTKADSALESNAENIKAMVEESEQAVERKIATCPAADDELKKSSVTSKDDALLAKGELKTALTSSETAKGLVPSEELKNSSGKTDSPSLPNTEIKETPKTSLPPKQSEESNESKSGSSKVDSPIVSTSEKSETLNESKTAESAGLPEKSVDSSSGTDLASLSTSSNLKPLSTPKEVCASTEKTKTDSALESNGQMSKALVEESEQVAEEKMATSPAVDDEMKKCSNKSKEKDTVDAKGELKSTSSVRISEDGSCKPSCPLNYADIREDEAKGGQLHPEKSEPMDVQEPGGRTCEPADSVPEPSAVLKETDSESSTKDSAVVVEQPAEDIVAAQHIQPSKLSTTSREKLEEPSKIEVPSAEKFIPDYPSHGALQGEPARNASENMENVKLQTKSEGDGKVVQTAGELPKGVMVKENAENLIVSSVVSVQKPMPEANPAESFDLKELVDATEKSDDNITEVVTKTGKDELSEVKPQIAAKSKDSEAPKSQSANLEKSKISEGKVPGEKSSTQNDMPAVTLPTSSHEFSPEDKGPPTVSSDEVTKSDNIEVTSRKILTTTESLEGVPGSGLVPTLLEEKSTTTTVTAKESGPMEEAKFVDPAEVDDEAPSTGRVGSEKVEPQLKSSSDIKPQIQAQASEKAEETKSTELDTPVHLLQTETTNVDKEDIEVGGKKCDKSKSSSVSTTAGAALPEVSNQAGRIDEDVTPKMRERETQPEPMETASDISLMKEGIKTEDDVSNEVSEEQPSAADVSEPANHTGAMDTDEMTDKSSSITDPETQPCCPSVARDASVKDAALEDNESGKPTENSNGPVQTSDAEKNEVIKSEEVKNEVCVEIKEESEIESATPPQVKEEHITTEIEDVKSENISSQKKAAKQSFSKFKSTYELMKSMDFDEPKGLYNEPNDLNIVSYEKLSFFASRLKEIQKDSDISSITKIMMFTPYNATDEFVIKSGLLCKRKDLQKNEVFIVLLKTPAVYREIVSALTEQYPDLDFTEFMSLIDSSFAYVTSGEIKSLTEAIDVHRNQTMKSIKYQNFIQRCNIVNYEMIQAMLEQLRTMQKADRTILHRYNRLKVNDGVDDSYILKYDIVCQFVGTIDFKVWLPTSHPDQIAIMYIVHETNHEKDLVRFLELMRATFEGVNASLIDKPIALCSVCHPPATANATSIVKACEQKCRALKSLPPEVIFKMRQIQMASSVYKAQIDLLTKGQSRQGSRYILDTSLLCKAMTKGTEQVFRVVISPSGLKEVVSLLHTHFHRKSLSEFVSFVNEFLAVTEEVCKVAFQNCYMCNKSKSSKMVDKQKSPSPSIAIHAAKALEKSAEPSKKETKESTDDSPKILSEKVAMEKEQGSTKRDSKDTSKSTKDTSRKEPPKDTPTPSSKAQASTSKDSKKTEPEPSKTTWEVKAKASEPPRTHQGDRIRKRIMKDLRTHERIWGSELGDRIRYIMRLVPDRVLSDVNSYQRSCPELLKTIKDLEKIRPVRDAKEMLCGGILFVLKSKLKPKIAVKPVKHINYLLITKFHSEVHDWTINKVHGTIGIIFDVSPCKEEVEATIDWFCQSCMKPEIKKKKKIYSSVDEQLEAFYSTLEPILTKVTKATAPKEKKETPRKTEDNKSKTGDDSDIIKGIHKDFLKLDEIWGKELSDRIKAISHPLPDKLLKAVIVAQRECSELIEIIEPLETSTPIKDARYVLCGGILYVVRSKKKAMLVKIHVKPIKNINYILITNLHEACHDWNVNRLQTTIGISFDVSPTREEVAVTVEWFCTQCQKPDTSSKKKKTTTSLEEQLKDLYDTIDPSLLKSHDDDDDQEATIDLTQEVPVTDVRDALAKLPNPVVSKIQLAQLQSNVLNTQVKLLENTDGPAKGKRYCLVMSLLCKLVQINEKLAWRVMIPSEMLKELVVELHTVHYHDMIQEDFVDYLNEFMTVPEGMVNEVFASCALCLTTVRRVPTLCERGINEDFLRKTLATIAEMIEFVIKWQTDCPAIAKIRQGVQRGRKESIAEHILYKDILFKLCGKAKGGKGPRPKIAVSLLPNALDEVIKSTHAFYHSNNPNQLMNLINVSFDVTVPKNLLVTKIPELCNICRNKSEKAQKRGGAGSDLESNVDSVVVKEEPKQPDSAIDSQSTGGTVVKEEVDLPVEIKAEGDEPTPLGVLLLGRLCDQVIEESSNSSRALDSPVPDITSTETKPETVLRQTCKILLKRCKYDPEIVQQVDEGPTKKRKKETQKAPAKRSRPTKALKKVKEPESSAESDSDSESTLPKRKFVMYSSESETDDSTSKKRKASSSSTQKAKKPKK